MRARIQCLAPSDAAVVAMQARMREELLPKVEGRRLRVPTLSQNECSVVLAVKVEAFSFLLGADLEERNQPGLGWQVIIDAFPVGGELFEGFKIPHHGSETGHHPETWPRLTRPDAWAVLTPFNRQRMPLPRQSDCERILSMTERAYITASPGFKKFRHPNAAVQRTIDEGGVDIRDRAGTARTYPASKVRFAIRRLED